jgi:predicted Zn-dependent protease
LLYDVLRLAQLHADTGKTAAARAQFERATGLAEVVARNSKGVGQDRYYLAQSLRSLATTLEVTDPPAAIQYHRRAAAFFRDLAADYPGKPECRQALADVHVALGTLCPQDATEHFRTARDLFAALAADLPDGNPAPGSPGENHNKLAWFLATCPDPQFRDPVRAIEAARRAVKQAPKHADFWNTLGAACYRAGDPAETVTALKSAIALRKCGGDAMDWLLLAAAHRRLGQVDAARAARTEGLSLIDSRPGAHGNELVRLRTELEQASADPPAGAN